MATPFSWSDKVHITLSSCLPCLRTVPSNNSLQNHTNPNDDYSNPAINRIPRARPDELQGLLADASDTDVDVERLSLHSNPGRNRRKRKIKTKRTNANGNPRRISFFGYDLFGRNVAPPIHLPDDDDALFPSSQASSRGNGVGTPGTIATANSIATFDSDAAPLDAAIINELSSSTSANATALAAAAAEADAQRLMEKEERRQRRKEKKEMKRLAEVLKQQGVLPEDGNGQDFEGFQGSGSTSPIPPVSGRGYARIPNVNGIFPQVHTYHTGPGTMSDSGSGSAFSGREEFGRFVAATNGHESFSPPQYRPHPLPQGEDDDEAADLDGELYAGKTRAPYPNGRGSGGGSDSRSRTSTSFSDRHLAYGQGQQQPPTQPYPDPQAHDVAGAPNPTQYLQPQGSDEVLPKKKKKPSKKSSTASRTTKSHSSNASTSQSPSLASPTSTSFAASYQNPDGPEQKVVSPSTVEQGLGFFDLEDGVAKEAPAPSPAPAVTGSFPMTGFGGGGFGARRTRDMGAFLARRGEQEAGDGL